ncbi:MAG: hypothetical protein ACYCW6_01010 [Candidatus Xenobia bacterium]
MVCVVLMTTAAVAAPRYDILIVTNKSHLDQKSLAHELRQLLEKERADNNMTSEDLPVDEYDASFAGHKPALRRLHIQSSQIPFIGVCALGGKDALPLKVLSGVGPVRDVHDAVTRLIAATHRDLGWNFGGTTSDTAVHFDKAEMATGVDFNDYHPIATTERYQPGDSFYLAVHSPDFVAGTPVTCRWYEGTSLIGTKTISPNVTGSTNLYFQLDPKTTWPPGYYHCDVTVNDVLTRRVGFQVAGEQNVLGATTCQSLDEDTEVAISPTTTFRRSARLCVSIELQDVQEGDTVEVRFYNPSGMIGHPHLELRAERHTHCGFWVRPKTVWTTGESRVEIYYNGHLAQTVPFSIVP